METPYVLGHSEGELERLERQGRFLAGFTRDLLVRAGVGPGMRVLDFGAGAGDVTFLASELVGPAGEVVALERASEALGRARTRLEGRGVKNVRLVQGDDQLLPSLGRATFDAVVGRLVLLHQKDAAATIGTLAELLRPGGVMAFHEVDIEAGAWSEPRVPLVHQCWDWLCRGFQSGGMPSDIGRRMAGAFAAHGLVSRCVVREGILVSADSDAYEFLAQTVRSLLPVLTRLGLATAEEVGIDTLAERMRAEVARTGSQFIPFHLAAGWARKPL